MPDRPDAPVGAPAALDRRAGVTLVVVAASVVQIGAGFAKKLFGQVGPGGAVLLRCFFAAAVMAVVFRPRRSALKLPIALFGVATGLMNLSFYHALDRLPLGLAVTVEFVGPLGVAIAGSRRWRDGLWAVLAGTGVAVLTPLTGSHIDLVGLAFALGAGALWAAYIVIGERVAAVSSGAEALALSLPFALFVVAAFGLHDGGVGLLRPAVLGVGFVVAMFSTALPYTLEIEALRRISKPTFGLLMSLEPVIATMVGLVVLGEHLRWRGVVAVALILCANVGHLFSSG